MCSSDLNLDSNQDKQSQSLLCYRYTIPQSMADLTAGGEPASFWLEAGRHIDVALDIERARAAVQPRPARSADFGARRSPAHAARLPAKDLPKVNKYVMDDP